MGWISPKVSENKTEFCQKIEHSNAAVVELIWTTNEECCCGDLNLISNGKRL
jgi:hypothetical protein